MHLFLSARPLLLSPFLDALVLPLCSVPVFVQFLPTPCLFLPFVPAGSLLAVFPAGSSQPSYRSAPLVPASPVCPTGFAERTLSTSILRPATRIDLPRRRFFPYLACCFYRSTVFKCTFPGYIYTISAQQHHPRQ